MEFYAKKSAGEIVGDTFTFFKLYFKEFIKTIYPLMIFLILASSLNSYLSYTGNLLGILVGSIGIMIAYAIYQIISIRFIISKTQNQSYTYKELWNDSKPQLWSYIGGMFLYSLLIAVGTFVLVIPGIYFAIAGTLVAVIIVNEKKGASNSISRSFNLIKNNWWKTFFILFVTVVVVLIIASVFSLPLMLLGFSDFIFPSLLDVSTDISSSFVIIGVVQSVQNIFLYFIMNISSCLIYFSYKEEKEGDEELNAIESLEVE